MRKIKYRAYLKIIKNENEKQIIRIFPKSKKTSCFNSMDAALRSLEKKASKININSQGLIYQGDNLVYTIAL